MKKASPNALIVANSKRSKGRAVPVLAFFILMVLISWAVCTDPVAADPLTSSLITQVAFNPINQPSSFTVGVPNSASEPLRIQTQNAAGIGENVTGSGQTVFIVVTSSSSTGRFSGSSAGPFNQSTITVTVTNGRQNSQDIFYRDPTPGPIVLTGTVTAVANTRIRFAATTSITRSVIPVGVGRLSFGTQPGNQNKDAVISPAVTVRIEDAAGNLDASSVRNVTLAIGNNPAGGMLNGITTVAAIGGIATFNNLSINNAGNGYTLAASSTSPLPALTTAVSLPFNINKLDQIINFDELTDKTYGDEDFAIQATASSGSLVSLTSQSEDTCSVDTGTVRIVAAGICTIRAELAGDANFNAASFVDRSFEILKADAAVVIDPYDVVYNGQPHVATVVSITGVYGESGDEVGAIDLGATIHTAAGSYANDGWIFAGNPNYNDAAGTIANNISKAPVFANAGGGSSTYDGSDKTPTPCAISGPAYIGDLKCSNNPVTIGPNANTYSVSPSVNGTGLSNFEIAKSNSVYVIERAPTNVSVSFEPGPYGYRGTAFSATARVTGANGLDLSTPIIYSGDCLNVTAANGCAAASEFPDGGNYLGSIGSSAITISKRPLTVTASSHILTFGDPVPTVTPSFEGFVSGENASVIDLLPNCTTDYTVGSRVGTYGTNCSGGIDNNYSFASPFTPGAVIVNSACSEFIGFLAPIGGANISPNDLGPGGSFNAPLRAVKLNSTIPFKFAATCGGSALDAGNQTLSARKYFNGSGFGENALSNSRENRFQFSGGQWHLNFKTNEFGGDGLGTWYFEVTLFDGSKYGVWLALR